MGYQIKYAQGPNKKYPSKKKSTRIWRGFGVIVGCTLVLCATIAGSKLRYLLLPGDPEVTEAAMSKMIDTIRAGEGVQEAVSVFCTEVIKSGSQS